MEHLKPLILVVDDDVPIQLLMQTLLKEFGFRSEIAGNGEKALEMVNDGVRPDLVLLDMNMPGMSGADVLHELRVRLEQVPIVILSGERIAPDELQRLGATAAVQKPFDVAALVTQIRGLVA